MRLYNRSQGRKVIARQLHLADTFWKRLQRLIGKDELLLDEAVLIVPANCLNTYFLSLPVDVVFLDQEGKVVGMLESVMPWQTVCEKKAQAVLELAAGALCRHGCQIGDQLTWEA
ncbi:DUF192 domain-containing protein [Azotosporobacter soli]|uniref:DUF192 domain-containing protein n=1 Tax=Azotosporobacter soli TaxID=3055040 RepID=UPI0031FE9C41